MAIQELGAEDSCGNLLRMYYPLLNKRLLFRDKCFLVKYEDDPIQNQAQSWNAKVLRVSKSKRHLDRIAHDEFWSVLSS